jgi:hypothetical protein
VCTSLLLFMASELKICQFMAGITDQKKVKTHYVIYIATLSSYKCFVFQGISIRYERRYYDGTYKKQLGVMDCNISCGCAVGHCTSFTRLLWWYALDLYSSYIWLSTIHCVDWHGAVGIATRYGPTVLGSNPGGG